MQFVKPQLFQEAIDKIGARSPIGSKLNSEQWSDLPIALRERAFFSSQVENMRFLQRGRDSITEFLTGAREDTPGGPALAKPPVLVTIEDQVAAKVAAKA